MARRAKKRPQRGKRASPRRPAIPERRPGGQSRRAIRYATVLLCLVVLVARSTGALRAGGSVVFWLVAAAGLVHLVAQTVRTFEAGEPYGNARSVVAVLTVAGTVLVFDPDTLDTFNVTKLAVVTIGAALLLALAGTEWVVRGRPPAWRNELQWPVLALIAWTLIATATSSNVRMSLLGVYGSYNGVLSTVALVVVFFVAARAFRARDIQRILSVLWFSVAGLVITYAFLQLHDQLWTGDWDWVRWGAAAFSRPIWSTLGNPNHLAGVLAILLPIGVVLFVLASSWPRRVLVAGMSAILFFELLYTEGRGGWLGAGLALAVLAVFWSPELRRRPRLLLAGAGALAIVIGLSVVVLGDDVDLGSRVSSAFELSEGTQAQRIGQWQAAGEMVTKRPITGFGPETFRLHFNRYQPADFADDFGAENTTAGSHNIFTDYPAMVGLPGLAAFLWLLVAAARRVVRCWRMVRARETEGTDIDGVDPLTVRLLVAGVTAGIVAFLAQAAFNLQQIALWALFWFLLALLTVLARAVAGDDRAPEDQSAAAATSARWRTSVVAMAGVAAVVAVAVFATMPWRADRHFKQARIARNTAVSQSESGAASLLFERSSTEFDRATSLNRWEPAYLADAARLRLLMANNADELGEDSLALVREAVDLSRRAVRLRASFEFLAGYGDALLELDEVTDGGDPSAVRRAVRVFERAVDTNPESDTLRAKLEAARDRLP